MKPLQNSTEPIQKPCPARGFKGLGFRSSLGAEQVTFNLLGLLYIYIYIYIYIFLL